MNTSSPAPAPGKPVATGEREQGQRTGTTGTGPSRSLRQVPCEPPAPGPTGDTGPGRASAQTARAAACRTRRALCPRTDARQLSVMQGCFALYYSRDCRRAGRWLAPQPVAKAHSEIFNKFGPTSFLRREMVLCAILTSSPAASSSWQLALSCCAYRALCCATPPRHAPTFAGRV